MEVEEGKPTTFVEGPPGFESYYDVLEAIGVGYNGTLTIYKGRVSSMNSDLVRSSGFMYVNEEEKSSLQNEVNKMASVQFTSDILEQHWTTFSCRGYYCVEFPYPQHGSLLSFMARRFPRGLPEKFILFCARHILAALRSLHDRGRTHGEISAAHVFVTGNESTVGVKLAYASTVHHLLADQLRDSGSPYLPATSTWRWAAAPPHHNGRADDIWLIGITLLEMAYGGLRVNKRDDLDFLINKIRHKNKLPKKLNDDNGNINKLQVKWASPLSSFLPTCSNLIPKKKKKKKKKKQIAPAGVEYKLPEERVFSKGFVNLVIRCLDIDPAKRPTTHKLLQSKIFKRTRSNGHLLL